MIPKFRVWDKKEKKMCNVAAIWFSSDSIILERGVFVYERKLDEVELMQATGVRSIYDDGIAEIYEGDVVKTKSSPDGRFIGCVGNAVSRFEVRGVKQYGGWKDDLNGSYVVIGNEFQNPELLEDN
ncbi:YopX family protein [Staphylococcus epidermidis]|uniref:YopX family protein n=1 Tax=Staphylococcus epidermidis TaxID=1282 RepID=UPI002003DBD9|nr:YopX family protein [Staphylococcus epidermidis]MCG1905120.1 YopX family protein [Staphylococcus epidermidis]MCK6118922.1 YopX family protein [Staphylococcus epidermidis]MCK6155959.1 YopX family protein [Staphylococcus epidermidis]